ncbi:MAG: RNA polymerase sigma factor [Caulobacterales bacterium]
MSVDAEASDAALAHLAAAGDDQAFARLVRRHKDGIYRLLRRYTADPDEAYEAVQEAFIAAWKALGRYDADRPFLTWLQTIAINKARDRGRRMAVRRMVFGGAGLEGEAMAAADPREAADQAVIDRQLARRLDKAIGQLPGALKEALLLTAFEGYSHVQAGHMLGVSAKTVETRAYRARKLLAQRLDDDMRPTAS